MEKESANAGQMMNENKRKCYPPGYFVHVDSDAIHFSFEIGVVFLYLRSHGKFLLLCFLNFA